MNGGIATIYSLGGTADGFGATAEALASSTNINTTGVASLVIASIDNAGDPNFADAPTALGGLVQDHSATWGGGRRWGAHGAAHQEVASASNVAIAFSTNVNSGTSVNIAAVEFLAAADANAVPEPATATLAMLGLGGLMMRRRRLA